MLNRLRVFLVAALALLATSVATTGAQAAPTTDVGVQVARTLCYANDVDVRWTPGGSPTGRLVYRGQTVNVIDFRDGVWWEINSPYRGFVLAQYFC
ncbi:SH3 domain-containing protein [Saccharothrix obliqua]|uniref:SH3 domain-containing protein n=1 Tax=Saccharothrix obliqua TaxID=2861747 RepID=UPI001C5D335F|nr:SH3 domain-containing protein [Saccharothrix obliqua]MBW4717284.1 SH3 domain-containing protein [Saccharothrix obliqua]